MKKIRHTVEQIRPEIRDGFDQQFWPVLMAIVVLVSIAAGAIVTLIQGPWMWVSLLALPAAAAVAIVFLYRLDDSVLRRSLQIAILASFAIHLLILVATSLTFIFHNVISEKQVVVSNQPQRKIVISNKINQLVFQQPKKHSIPDPKLVPEKKQSTTRTKPQPAPVVKRENKVTPQLVERRVEQTSVPRLDTQLSKRSRNSDNVKPRTSQSSKQVKSPTPASQATAQAAAPSNTKLTRKSEAQKSIAGKQSASADSASRSPQQTVSKRRTQAAKTSDQAGIATARIRKNSPRIPKVAIKKSQSNNESQQVSEMAPATKSEPTQASITKLQRSQSSVRKTVQSPSTKSKSLVSASQRRELSQEKSSLPQKAVSPARKSTRHVAAKAPKTIVQPQTTQTAASANKTRRALQPKRIAVSRSTGGTMGSGRSRNLGRVTGGQPSPVNLASDSSNKRQSNRVSENIAMSSLQKSNTSERGRSETSHRVMRKDTARWARRSGAAAPSETTIQAAAANINSATVQSTNRSATEKGTSMLDLGATKVVPEIETDRRGGGGLPEINNSITQNRPTESGRQTNQSPTVAPTTVGQDSDRVVQAESTEVSREQNRVADQLARDPGNSRAVPGKNIVGNSAGDIDRLSQSDLGSIVSQTDRRTESSGDPADLGAKQTGEMQRNGNSRTRLAQAPNVDRQLGFGTNGQTESQVPNAANEGADESTAQIVKRATGTLSGGSMLGPASRVVATSLAGLPLFASGSGDGKRKSDLNSVVSKNDGSSSTPRANHSLKPKTNSELAPSDNKNSTNFGNITASETETETIDHQSVGQSVARSDVKLDLDAIDGSGGFAEIISRRVGKISAAVSENDNLSPNSETRFKRKEFGGVPAVSPNATMAKQAFRSRNPAALSSSGPKTEAAIEMGLEFLARHQLADGSWTLGQFDTDSPLYQSQLNSDAAATGLALLAFQGAGYNHQEFKYAGEVKRAIDWLIKNQAENGGLFVESDKASNQSCRMYSHAIAALALTESYGMTQDPDLVRPTQKALDYIASTQDSEKGGWRYYAKLRMRSSDTSVTGWMMMALKSGHLAGLKTNESTLEKIEAWLRVAQAPNSNSEFRYNPYAVDSVGKTRTHGKNASITMTSVGLLMRVYTGWGPNDPRFLRGAKVLLNQLPGDSDSRTRDTYYWYYATQVMKHAGGEYWDKWSSALHPLLVDTQETSGSMRGSWDPFRPVPDRWAPQGGRIYVTTMNLLSLEVKYRLLPLYENTIK